MDEYSHWEVAEERIPDRFKDNMAFQSLASEAALRGGEMKLSPRDFQVQLHRLYDAYGEFLYAMNPLNTEDRYFQHWYNRYRQANLGKKWGQPPITAEILSEAASKYLHGALRVASVDRAIIDAFIAQETFAFIDRHAGRGALLFQGGCFGAFIVGGLVWDMFFGTPHWTVTWRALGILAVVLAVVWAWPKRGPYALYRQMKDTYQLLTGSVVSVPELRRRVERARDRGVVWPAELYAVLDDVEARTKVL